MSFGDISKGTWAPRETSTKPGSSGDDIPAIGTSLQELQVSMLPHFQVVSKVRLKHLLYMNRETATRSKNPLRL